MHFVFALNGDLRVRTGLRGRWTTAAGVFTAPDSPHAVDSRGVEMLVIFFDPESDVGAALRPALEAPVRFITGAERTELVRGVEDPRSFVGAGIDAWTHRAATILGIPSLRPKRLLHPGIRRLLDRLRTAGFEDDNSLERLAKEAHLSSGRLMHVFTESVGIPLRPYLAWLRVQRACCAILSGVSLTEAAHTAGFADAPHMSRTFRRRLGITPSELRPVISSHSDRTGPRPDSLG